MLQIKIANSYFDIPNDIQIPISILNPLVSESAFNEIYTYSFTLQNSPRNKSIYFRYVNKNETISISFQSHLLATGVAIMKMDSSGISIMIKNDAANLRQSLEKTSFDEIELPVIPICNENDLPTLKISKWNDFMNSKLPVNESWDEGMFKFPPIYAAPALEWAINEDQSGREINATMWDNGFPINDYSLLTGEYISNYGIALPLPAEFKATFPIANSILPGHYFVFNNANNIKKYYCWYVKNGVGIDPAPSDRIGIQVNIYDTDDEIAVAGKTAIQISYLINDFEVIDFGTGTIQVTNIDGGITINPSNENVTDLVIFDINNGSGTTDETKNNWRTTVSPCIRIDYFLNKIAEKFNLKIEKGFLDNIPEYKALVNYVGKVLDQREDYDNYQYNVHGTEIDLNKFKPNSNLIEIFKLLNHLFGVAFNYINSKLVIEPIKLNLKPFDVSKFCMPDFTINELENKSLEYTYGLGDDFWKYGDWYIAPGLTGKYLNYYQNSTIGNGSSEFVEIPFSILRDSNYKATSFGWPELAKSQVYNPNDFIASSKLIIGLFRGEYLVKYTINTNPLVPPVTYEDKRLICFNHNVILENEGPSFGEIINYDKKLGTCSIYANSEESYLSIYANFQNIIKSWNQEIEKNMNLPFHKIIEIMKWKQPIHAIQQRNMSFAGIVKELKFTIGKNVISPTTITYLSNKNIESGDYNIDFNNDFNS